MRSLRRVSRIRRVGWGSKLRIVREEEVRKDSKDSEDSVIEIEQ